MLGFVNFDGRISKLQTQDYATSSIDGVLLELLDQFIKSKAG